MVLLASKFLSWIYIFSYVQSAHMVVAYFIFLLVNRQWNKFEDSYRLMMFSNGDKCWNGPDRSLKVVIALLISSIVIVFSFIKDDALSFYSLCK